MIKLNYFLLTVNLLSVYVKFTVSNYDAVESYEVISHYDDETLTTRVTKKEEEDYPNVDETTTAVYSTTTDEDATTTLEDLHTTVEDFIYTTNAPKAVGDKKSTEMHIGRVYQILESIINDGITDRSVNKTEFKPVYRVYDSFEDVMNEEIAAIPFEVTTNIAVDYVDKTLQEVTNEILIEFSGENITNPLCPRYIYSPGFKMEKMADVWQPVYYDLGDKLNCFKILIKKTSQAEREQYEQKYGNYNESMNWKECHFEIKSNAVKYRKHFLQGVVGDLGVMRNIILVKNKQGGYDLQEETPDQWLMLKSLLLLRDCQTGGVIAFARVPYLPPKADIIEALEELGVKMRGKSICNS